jgi:hypothetical protein
MTNTRKRNFLKRTLIVLLILAATLVVSVKLLSEPLPTGLTGPQADALAMKIEQTLGKSAYDNLSQIKFSFRNHHYNWLKMENKVIVTWDEYTVHLDLNNTSVSEVLPSNLSVEAKSKLVRQATAFFYNDSYWLVAPFKFFDPGVERRLVKLDEAADALLITHTSGGVTPGDSYLWIVDQNGRPTSFKLWVSIIPIKGISASWEGWTMASCVQFSTQHKLGPLAIEITGLEVR